MAHKSKQDQVREATWEFPTIPTRKPLSIKLESRTDDVGTRRMVLLVGGLLNPHVQTTNYIGDEAKNPALLPISQYINQAFIKAMHEQIAENPQLQKSFNEAKKYAANAPQMTDMLGGNMVVFNFSSVKGLIPLTHKRVKPKDMNTLFDAMCATIEKMKPEISQMIAAHAKDQPPETLTPMQQYDLHGKVAGKWQKVVQEMEGRGIGRSREGSIRPKSEDN